MKKNTIAALAALLVTTSAANAQDMKPYIGVGMGVFGLEVKDSTPGFALTQKNNVFGGFFKAGVDINEYIGAELRVGTTANGKTSYPTGTLGATVPFDITLQNDYFFSYLGKLQFPASQDFKLYALIGATTAKFTPQVSALGLTFTGNSVTKTGFSYGVGGEFNVNDQMSIGAEWVQYWTDVALDPNSKGRLWGAAGTLNYHF